LQNLVINGRFDFWQRGAGFIDVTTRTYTADRWAFVSAAPFTVTRKNAPVAVGSPNNGRYVVRVHRTTGSATNPGAFNTEIDRDFVRLARSAQARITFSIRKGANFSGTMALKLTTGTGAEAEIDATGAGYSTGPAEDMSQALTLQTYWQRLSYVTAGTIGDAATCAALHFVHTPAGTAGADDWYEVGEVMVTREGLTQPLTIPEAYVYAGGSSAGELALCEKYFEKSYKLDTAPGTAADYSVTSVMLDAVKQAEPIRYRVRKNTAITSVPVVALYDLDGTPGSWSGTWVSKIAATATSRESLLSVGPTTLSEATAGSHFYGHWTADAEFY
jgi:hypothetical protein